MNIHSWSDVKWKSVSVARRWILRKACINGAKKKLVLVPFVAGDEILLIFSTDTFFYFSWNVSGDRYT